MNIDLKRIGTVAAMCVAVLCAMSQEVLTMEQCRSLALQHNKEVAAAKMQTAFAWPTSVTAAMPVSPPMEYAAKASATVKQITSWPMVR